jgi:hypothetical protein
MKLFQQICLGLLVLLSARLSAQTQVEDAPTPPRAAATNANNSAEPGEDRMVTPPPVSGQSYPVGPVSQERSNYLRGGVTFSTAYSDNILGSTGSTAAPVSDISYSIWPTIALDETTTRLHWTLNYAPGFTFYQRTSSRNEADQNASINVQYRLTRHVTFSANDGFQKSSNVFNQPDLAGTVSGGAQGGDLSVIAPVASQLRNGGNVGITYQFAANQMVGAGGSFTNLHYPDPTQVPGLFDSESQSGSGFYAFRASEMHYLGIDYQYQRLLTFPTQGQNETQTHAILGFYTLSPSKRFSISVFGGPQYLDIGPQFESGATTPIAGSTAWKPMGGASLNWQGQFTSLSMSYAHTVSTGGGLIGAVQGDSANASFHQQLARTLGASVSGGYSDSTVVGGLATVPGASTNGHIISGTASLQQQLGQHLNLQLGYSRIHQSFNVAAVAATPDTNREFVSVSYQFSRPLGR